MNALILAAGIGSRLRPITSSKPKCMTKVAGKPILEYQLDALIENDIRDIVILAGYEAEKVDVFLKFYRIGKKANIVLVKNNVYESTNNMYSLYLAKQHLGGKPFLLLNGDVPIEPEIIKRLLQDNTPSLVCVDRGTYYEESMKIKINKDGYVCDMNKTIPKIEAFAISIDIYKFSTDSARILLDLVTKIIEIEKSLKDWTEVAMQRLFLKQELKMKPINIHGLNWFEVDNFEDLAIADVVFSKIKLSSKKTYIFDLDGTLYIGNKAISGSDKLLEQLRLSNNRIYFLSNNSSNSKQNYVKKLANIGINAKEKEIVLSTDGALAYLKNKKVEKIYVFGTNSLRMEVVNAGFSVINNDPQYVLVGYDTELTYDKLKNACSFILKGTPYIATHPDLVCPTEYGPIPDIGSMLECIKTATKTFPEKIFGKPDSSMLDFVFNQEKVDLEEVVIIGDRLYTDMKLAKNLGVDFILVLSGETKREDIEEESIYPELVLKDVTKLLDIIN